MTRSHGLSRRAQGRIRQAFIEQLEARHLLASDYLLVLEGIKGESSDSAHPGAIEIQSFSWGASNPSREASPATTEEFRFVTGTSIASPLLYQAAAQGKHFTKAVLYGRKAGGDQTDYLKVELKDILISSFQTRSLNEELPKEEIALEFSSITQQVTTVGSDGTPGATTSATWSMPRRVRTVESVPLLEQQPSSNLDQTDAFLLIDGIKGETTDDVYKDAIPIESFSWGASQSLSNVGRASFQDLHFVSEIGKASPILARSAATGKHFSEATLVVRRSSAINGADNFIKITLSDVIISSYSTGASSGTSPMEEIKLSFGSITQSVSSESSSGGTVVSSKLSTLNAETRSSDSLIDNTIPTAAAADFLLEIDGIKGESAVNGHKGAIELDSFSWGVSQGAGSGGGAGKVSLQDFHFSSATNAASPLLFSSTASGSQIAKAVLTVRKSGDRPLDFIKIQLEDLLVSSYRAQGMNNQQVTDEFSLSFDKLAFAYQPAPSADGQLPLPIKITWNAPRTADRVTNTVVPLKFTSTSNEPSARYYIKFDGIDGESTNQDHKGEIEVMSWSSGVSRSGITSTSSGMSAGKVSFQDFHFVTSSSKASPKLYEKVLASPSAGERAHLTVRRTGATSDYMKISLARPDLQSVQVQSIDRSLPVEEYSALFLKLDMRYAAPGGAVAAPILGSGVVIAGDPWEYAADLLRLTAAPAGRSDYFLKIDGIKGESSDAANPNSIDVQSFSWGVSKTGKTGQSSGKVSLQDFHFVTDSSSATPQLLQAFARGKHFPNAVLVSRASGQPANNYLKIKLTDVLVSSYQTQGTDSSAPQDEVSLNFIKIDTTVARPNGSAPVSSSLDFSRMRNQVKFEQGESLLSISAPSSRASDYFLKIDGIKGESADKAHKGWIELDSFSWGASREVTSSRKVGGIKYEGLSFGANTDKSSPQLLSSFSTSERISGATLEIVGASGRTHLKYELSDVLISSFSLSGSESDETDFSASFGQLSVTVPPIANIKGIDLTGDSVDLYYTDQDEFIAGKKRR